MSSISDKLIIIIHGVMLLFTLFCFLWALTNDFIFHYPLFSAFPAPPLKLIDLPGIDQRVMDDSTVSTSCNVFLSFFVNYLGKFSASLE